MAADTGTGTRTPPKAPARVIVVGSGLAGLSASSELVSRNIPVHIVERQQKPGGNSIKASSGINGAPTRYQPPGSDSAASFYEDTLRSVSAEVMATMTARRQSLISTLTNSSASAINWLVDEKGIDLSRVAQLGGHSHARTHRGAGTTPPGASIVLTLLKQLKENPLVKLETGTTVTKVLKSDNNEVVGVEVQRNGSSSEAGGEAEAEVGVETEVEVLKGPVVFTSGGFAGDSKGILAHYRPDLAGYPSTNEALPGSQGLLTEIGAQLLDMDLVQIHPTGFIDPKEPYKATKFLAAEMLRGEGGILLRHGSRFIDELQTRKVVTGAITSAAAGPVDMNESMSESMHDSESESKSVPVKQWHTLLLLDEGAYEAAKAHVDFYLWKGLMRKTTVGELNHADTTLESIKTYSAVVQGKAVDPLGRTTFGRWKLSDPTLDSVVYVGTVTPVVHYTMGGVVFTPNAEVLDATTGMPIRGLWAAGEITGGIHGANRLGGSSLLECVVFGRIAGQNAAAYVEGKSQ
ncbi:aromatic-L-amino-acid decarboxylase [Capronia coronata CBS 617.96]|uniref:Fumarate reductase n=1 Tax=Capronia coronata CBS 617.96 TaxID=1182541 RepID=W9YEC4_9EURO|nr:aromatic-L-amino-acid decarboxylase [Capronia coronata CBS 617.96]EXJ91232.1 aromatic-L-amino-acid decarboxylase [Capronia coronata CBS 617.96]